MRALPLLLLAGVCWADPPPRPEPVQPQPTATPKGYQQPVPTDAELASAAYEPILNKIVAATHSPDFTMWWDPRPPLRAEPEFVGMGSNPGVASALDAGHPEVRVGLAQMRSYTKNDDEAAFILAHEVMHLLFWKKDDALGCDDFLAWFKQKDPKNYARWQAEADAKTAAAGALSPELKTELEHGALARACVAHESHTLLAYVTWRLQAHPFQREIEARADHWAWKLAEAAGYDPRRGRLVFARMAGRESSQAWGTFGAHYPASLRDEELRRYADSKYQWMPPPD